MFHSLIEWLFLRDLQIAVIGFLLTWPLSFSSTSQADTINLVIKGSSTILPIPQNVAEQFENQCGNVEVHVIRLSDINASEMPLTVNSAIDQHETLLDSVHSINRPLLMFTNV